MSIHTDRERAKARYNGGVAGSGPNAHFWKLSKREIIEAALHLASLATGEYHPPSKATTARLDEEIKALRDNGII